MPYWQLAQKKTMLQAARHATVNAAMMKPALRQALAVTGCTGLCTY